MRKIIIFALLILSSMMCLFFVQESYAKYLTSANRSASMSIARWKILVNNTDIKDNSSANATITPVFEGNDNIASNIIAPTSTGYFDLVIDASQADVSFKYDISIAVNENSSVQDLVATGYQIDNGELVELEKDNQTIGDTVMYTDSNKVINIRVYILWDDSEDASMDNTDDTVATINPDNSALMDVNLTFTQVAN